MRIKRIIFALIVLLSLCIGRGHAQGETKLAVAALNLPPGDEGLLHWRDGDGPTEPIQVSIRYFSDFISLKSGVLRLYEKPVLEESKDSPPRPLYSLKLPAGTNQAFLVLTSQSENGQVRWAGQLIPGKDLKQGSLKLFNASGQILGIQVPDKNTKLLSGKSLDFHSKDFAEHFPVKIYELDNEQKKIFSSVWRISPHRREICFVYRRNQSLSLRSLLFLPEPPQKKDKE